MRRNSGSARSPDVGQGPSGRGDRAYRSPQPARLTADTASGRQRRRQRRTRRMKTTMPRQKPAVHQPPEDNADPFGGSGAKNEPPKGGTKPAVPPPGKPDDDSNPFGGTPETKPDANRTVRALASRKRRPSPMRTGSARAPAVTPVNEKGKFDAKPDAKLGLPPPTRESPTKPNEDGIRPAAGRCSRQ